jgi:DNA-binding NarL/FixJ family response regulator
MGKIQILLADDHRLFRQGIRLICEETANFTIVGEAEDGKKAVQMAARLHPDIILMDIQMPVLDGVQATRQIIEANKDARIIILTMHDQDSYVFEAIKAGARGYVLKDADWQDLSTAIQIVYQGEAIVPPSMALKVLTEFRNLSQNQSSNIEDLTPAEMDILHLVAQGKENEDIAKQLFLSDRTVANRLSEIYRKLHVNNRTQAALKALKKGWTNLDNVFE